MSIISTVPKGAAVEGINPNLLRNWYFVGGGTGRGVFPINQRGNNSYSYSAGGGYSINNWKLFRGVASLQSSGLSLAWGGSSFGNYGCYLRQYYDLDKLLGKTVTFSALTESGFLNVSFAVSNSYQVDSDTVDGWTLSSTVELGQVTISIWRKSETAKLLYAVKFELGSEQTLAHQENGAWVLNEIPDYEEEYYRCVTSDIDNNDAYANQKVSNITVQCNSVGSSSLRYYNNLIQSTHKVLDSTFSNPAAQTSDITVTTYDGYLDFSNGFASGATTNITLVLGTSGPVLSTSTTAPS